ncbi:pre-mRNA-splicing factor ATP-dependent RNA helicase DEAH10-like [Lycium ferocissimum]|uniref:pre-mRNA-splicing factor ATP-dependent RNA helicase DEAH10-like n=1 Tax=Lycium ferocissimum TaxID=112874 RepID=UPI002814D361|nr:pre-mRNA-splicing factor ATP-dependent RNA helicase DEAH10-like [Lycium ferocissimum]
MKEARLRWFGYVKRRCGDAPVRRCERLILLLTIFAELPQYLFKGGFFRDGGIIGITQPRRVAAITVAKRVAEECGVSLGQKFGYAIRFEDVTSALTKIKYMTDGLLLREALLDSYLSKYSAIIFDEAHVRTIHTDVLLGLLKNVQKARSKRINEVVNTDHNYSNNRQALEGRIDNKKKYNPLKLIIMSASLDARVFSEYFGGAKAVHVQGRQFPVDIFDTPKSETDCLDPALITIFQIHLEEGPGDILVFLTGQEEIESVERLIHECLRQLPECNRKLLTFPIFSSLPSEKQMKVFMPLPAGYRKVILATNIAETSVTIPGIKYVVDPGLVKARTYDPKMGVDSLIIVTTSKAKALQRRYLSKGLKNIDGISIGKRRILKALGIDDIINFDFIEKLDRLPLDPIYSKAPIVASQLGCLKEMLICVAMLLVESIFYAPREKLEESRNALKSFASPQGDHLMLLNVYRAADEFFLKKQDGKYQILRNVEQMGLRITSCEDDTVLLRRCLAASCFLKAAMKLPYGAYRWSPFPKVSNVIHVLARHRHPGLMNMVRKVTMSMSELGKVPITRKVSHPFTMNEVQRFISLIV